MRLLGTPGSTFWVSPSPRGKETELREREGVGITETRLSFRRDQKERGEARECYRVPQQFRLSLIPVAVLKKKTMEMLENNP